MSLQRLKSGLAVSVAVLCLGAFTTETCLAKDVYARKRKIAGWEGIATGGDHTYVCTQGGSAKERCYSRTGGSKDGSKVSQTRHDDSGMAKCVYDNGYAGDPAGACHVNNDTTGYFSSDRNGTCHQEANLMLRKSKDATPAVTVNNYVNGGGVTLQRFGYYGNHNLPENCKKVCP